MKKFIITEEEKNEIRGLYESTVITSPENNDWCKKNITDDSKQICIIKTPNIGDRATCVKSTGPLARTNGYTSNILSDVSEENFCKTIWGKL